MVKNVPYPLQKGDTLLYSQKIPEIGAVPKLYRQQAALQSRDVVSINNIFSCL